VITKLDKLFVIIPVLNRWEQTRNCLNSLLRGSHTDFTVIVVDHGSTDATRSGLETEFPDVIRLPGVSDLWWAGATNTGIREALRCGAQTIMLLNNDCYLLADTIELLARHHQAAPYAIIAPVQRNMRSREIITRPMMSCFLLGFPTLLLPGRHLYQQNRTSLADTRLIIGGRGVLIPADVFGKAGIFNESELPHYGADHDFYLRCRKQGVRLCIAQDALVEIDENTTTLSRELGRMTVGEFVDSLSNRRSHRNIPELTNLFRLHYPIPGLYPLGVALNLLRYLAVYIIAHTTYALSAARHKTTGQNANHPTDKK
jgi:GT2 family glycosyltransferase